MKLKIYTKNNCSFCDRAKALMDSKGVQYEVINIEEMQDAREMLVDYGLRSVPQIFTGSTLIPGGYQGLASQPEEFWAKFQG
jgi:glutaredoxin